MSDVRTLVAQFREQTQLTPEQQNPVVVSSDVSRISTWLKDSRVRVVSGQVMTRGDYSPAVFIIRLENRLDDYQGSPCFRVEILRKNVSDRILDEAIQRSVILPPTNLGYTYLRDSSGTLVGFITQVWKRGKGLE